MPVKAKQPLGGPSALPQRARLSYPRYQAVHTEDVEDLEGVVPYEAERCLI